MSTTTAHITPSASLTGAHSPVNGRLSFGGVLRGEWIKLMSLRSMRWSIFLMVALSFGAAAMMASAMKSYMSLSDGAIPLILVQSAAFGTVFTVLIMGVIGVLAMTSEYASGMILSSLTAVPSRTPLFLAKGLAVALLPLIVGAVSVFGGGIIAALITGDGAMTLLFSDTVLVSLLGAVLYLTLAALMSYGIGTMLRSSAAAISLVVVLLFVSTIAMQFLGMTNWEWVPVVTDWIPPTLGQSLETAAVSVPSEFGGAARMEWWPAFTGLVVWALAALIPAGILFKSRDAV